MLRSAMRNALKWTTSKTDEKEFSSLSEMLKIDFRKMAHAHLASQESELIMQSYDSFMDGVMTKIAADGTEIRVESKVRENDYFKYSKLFIMNPERDAEGNIVYDKKGKPVMDKSLNDTEIIPWQTDRDEYLQKNVAPYSPDFVVDEKKTKIGYEIPFTREFYKYTPLKPSADIFEELKALEQQEADIMYKILHL